MPAFILTLFKSKLARQIGGFMLLVGTFGAYGWFREAKGETKERKRELLAEAETRKNTKDKTDDAEKTVGAMSFDDVKRVLESKWYRD